MLQCCSQQTNRNFLFSKILLSAKFYHFKISFSAFIYSLDVFSLFHRLFFLIQYRIKNMQLSPGIEARTTYLTHKHFATELLQPAGKQILQFCIYTVQGYCYYATVSLSTDQWKFLFSWNFFYSTNLSLHNFFLSLLYSLDVFTLFHRLFYTDIDNTVAIGNQIQDRLLNAQALCH